MFPTPFSPVPLYAAQPDLTNRFRPAFLQNEPFSPLRLLCSPFLSSLQRCPYLSPLSVFTGASFSPLSTLSQTSDTQQGTARSLASCHLVTHISRVLSLLSMLSEQNLLDTAHSRRLQTSFETASANLSYSYHLSLTLHTSSSRSTVLSQFTSSSSLLLIGLLTSRLLFDSGRYLLPALFHFLPYPASCFVSSRGPAQLSQASPQRSSPSPFHSSASHLCSLTFLCIRSRFSSSFSFPFRAVWLSTFRAFRFIFLNME